MRAIITSPKIIIEIDSRIDYEVKSKHHQTRKQIAAENELFSHALKSEIGKIKARQNGLSDYLSRQKLPIFS
jgi:hypothetical protein